LVLAFTASLCPTADVTQRMREALAVPAGPVELKAFDPAAKPLAPMRNGKHTKLITEAEALASLQERLFAEATTGAQRSVLLVLQGMDTSGKGGVTNHVVGALEPIGVHYAAFKKPTEQELAHDFLWRIRRELPKPGVIGVFDRSHYEDVLVPLVHGLATPQEIERRYQAINDFEAELIAGGVSIIKCFLHISGYTQRERLIARLDDKDKHWKFNPGDLTERARWDDYQHAYELMLERCNPPSAPWFIVPSDSKKYRNWAIAELLRETLEGLAPQYPRPHLDVAKLRAELLDDGID
jgi:PPK2 family polyphosphate:nucleotide phosphotransferase